MVNFKELIAEKIAAVTEIDGVVAAKCKLKVNLSNTNN